MILVHGLEIALKLNRLLLIIEHCKSVKRNLVFLAQKLFKVIEMAHAVKSEYFFFTFLFVINCVLPHIAHFRNELVRKYFLISLY